MNGKLVYLLLLAAVLGLSKGQESALNDINEDEIKNKLNEAGIDVQNFNSSNIPIEQIEKSFKEKCEQVGADASVVDELKNQKDGLQECIQMQVNVTKLQEEIEEAKKTGSMDEVFGKYCKKYPEIYACFYKLTETAKQCMTENEKTSLNLSMNIVKELKEFVCFKDGDRIAMFVAEGGLECMKERNEAVQQCLNSTFGSNVKVPDDLNTFKIPEIAFTNETCGHFETIRDCIVHELEQCKDSTPANIVDALFKFLRKLLPCKQDGLAVQQAEVKKNSTGMLNSSIFLVILAVFTIFHQ